MTCFLWPPKRIKNSGGGVLPEKLGGVCSTLPETLTLFQTKICDFPYPISDLIKNLIPYFRPEALEPGAWPERVTSCYGTYTVVGVNIKREMVLSPNDEEVANSSIKHTQFKTRRAQNIPCFRPKWSKLIPYFKPKRLKKTFWLGTYLYSLNKGLPLSPPTPAPGAKNALQIMNIAACASENNKAKQNAVTMVSQPLW